MSLPNIIQQINSKLPLSGGTMTGNINWNKGVIRQNGDSFEFIGDKDLPNQNSFIACRSATHPSESGWFYFGARNTEGGCMGICKPDGTFTWGGKNVITSAGGTITGSITNTHNKGLVATNSSHMDVGYDYNQATGGLIALRSSGYTNNPGGFEIFARNETASISLAGKVNGTLTWGGKPVVCVTKWTSGTSGYRKYADGFIEQWGKCTSRNITVTFPLAFSNTNYTLVGGLIPGDPTQSYQHLNFKSQTATSFYFQSYDNYTCKWYACGY